MRPRPAGHLLRWTALLLVVLAASGGTVGALGLLPGAARPARAADDPLTILPTGTIALTAGMGTATVANASPTPVRIVVSGQILRDGAMVDLGVSRKDVAGGAHDMIPSGGAAVYQLSGSGGPGVLTVRATLAD